MNRSFKALLLALGAGLALSACGASNPSLPTAAVRPASTDYHLGPGDEVDVVVFGDTSLSGKHQLDGNGAFTFPLIGTVRAGGQTSKELAATLRTQLAEYMRDPNVSVEILNYRPFYIVGEVRQPGSYPYVDGMNVINAVAIAGGFSYRAKKDEFVIQRKGDESAEVAANQATSVLPGDVVVVSERFF